MIGSLVYGDGPRPRLTGIRQERLLGPHGWMRVLSAGDCEGVQALLIHGTPGNASGWSRMLSAPPSGVLLVAPDRPGFGASEPRHALPSLRDQAASLVPMLERSQAPSVLIGHSLGAPIACMAAAMWPELVAGLLLVSGAMDPCLERVRWYNWACRGAGPIVSRSLRNANREIWDLRSELEALQPLLGTIRCPVSLVHGTRDRLAPIANADYAARFLVDAKSVRRVDLPGVGHFVPWQRQAVVVEELVHLTRYCSEQTRPINSEESGADELPATRNGSVQVIGVEPEAPQHLTGLKPHKAQ